MQIRDDCGVLKHIQKLTQDTNTIKEYCAVAIADYNGKEEGKEDECCLYDYCMIEDIGGITNESTSTIPRKVSYLLLNTCKTNGKIPVILHSHIIGYEYSEPIKFSPQDQLFMEKFVQCAKKIGGISKVLFIVTNGNDTAHNLIDVL